MTQPKVKWITSPIWAVLFMPVAASAQDVFRSSSSPVELANDTLSTTVYTAFMAAFVPLLACLISTNLKLRRATYGMFCGAFLAAFCCALGTVDFPVFIQAAASGAGYGLIVALSTLPKRSF